MNELIKLTTLTTDVNVPKFMAQDLPLFDGIMSDLFPGIERPDIDYGALMQSIKTSAEELGFQPLQIMH